MGQHDWGFQKKSAQWATCGLMLAGGFAERGGDFYPEDSWLGLAGAPILAAGHQMDSRTSGRETFLGGRGHSREADDCVWKIAIDKGTGRDTSVVFGRWRYRVGCLARMFRPKRNDNRSGNVTSFNPWGPIFACQIHHCHGCDGHEQNGPSKGTFFAVWTL